MNVLVVSGYQEMAKKTVTTARQATAEQARTGRIQKQISIPADLHRRLEEYPNENWSAVARQAFELRLGEFAKLKESKSMVDVLSRLRASKLTSDTMVYRDGFARGIAWAKDKAEVYELVHLDQLRLECGPDWIDWFNHGIPAPASTRLWAVIDSFENPARGLLVAKNFFGELGINDLMQNESQMIRGFAEGALSVWDSVKDKL